MIWQKKITLINTAKSKIKKGKGAKSGMNIVGNIVVQIKEKCRK